MNIFLLDEDMLVSASCHPDKLIVRMPLETCQMLANCTEPHGLQPLLKKDGTPYKLTHANHPCTLWAKQSLSHTTWLAWFGISLCEEYSRRYNKRHSCEQTLRALVKQLPEVFAEPKVFPVAINDDVLQIAELCGFKAIGKLIPLADAVALYRFYLSNYKLHYACWSYGPKPSWWHANSADNGLMTCKLPSKRAKQLQTLSANMPETSTKPDIGIVKLGKKRKAKGPAIAKPKKQAYTGPGLTDEEAKEHQAWCIDMLYGKKKPRLATIKAWYLEFGPDEFQTRLNNHVLFWEKKGLKAKELS